MLDRLLAAEKDLPSLLGREGWLAFRLKGLDRLLRPWRDGKLFLHRIHPGPGELHPHPWPSAMRILEGRYELTLGFRETVASRLIASAPFEYEMLDPDLWHAVRALDGPVMTVMVSGPRWNRAVPAGNDPIAFPEDEVTAMLEWYRRRYR